MKQNYTNPITPPFPCISSGDSIDWKEPTPDEIVKRVMDKTESGSILLFHNDLENTTEALPQILERLAAEGYEFVTVSDLIYHENYTVNAQGEQVPDVLSSLGIDTDNVDEVMAEYSDEIAAAGFSEEQIAQAAEAIKNGSGIPDEVLAVIASFSENITANTNLNTGNAAVDDTADNVGLVENTENTDKAQPQK